MKPLLIHNDNSFLISQYNEKVQFLRFSTNNRDQLDFQITGFIHNKVTQTNPSAIFIKVTLSKNYLEYIGLRLAIHIRLSREFSYLQKLPIIILCEETFEELSKTWYIPELLFTEGIYFSNENPRKIDRILGLINEGELPGCNSISNFVNMIHMPSPTNYQSHHSIANEWCILRWAKALAISDNNILIQTAENNVNNLLYYKYLQIKYPIQKQVGSTGYTFKNKGKILYIDDEWNKGWGVIFSKLIGISAELKNNFETFIYDFKDKKKDIVVEDCKNKIIKTNPDVVILDLRLSESDFECINPKELSGFKILNLIKNEINRGIQVIIFSATNKVWNLQTLQDAGADGFMIKESPEFSIDEKSTIKSIENIYKTIDECLKRSFLKEFYRKHDLLKKELVPRKNFKKSPNPLPKEFVDEVLKWLGLSNDLLNKGLTPTSLTASFLFYFSVIENIANRVIDIDNPIEVTDKPGKFKFEFRQDKRKLKMFIEDKYNPGYYRKTNTTLESYRNLPWIWKILNTLDYITNEQISNEELNSIIKKRNDIIHANATTGDRFTVEPEMIITLYTYIFNGLITIR